MFLWSNPDLPRGTESLQTPRWRKADSNRWSHFRVSTTRHRPDVAERQQRDPAPSPNSAVATITLFDQSSRRNDNAHNSTTRKKHRLYVSWVNMKPAFSRNSDEAGRLDAGLANRGNSRTGDRDLFPARTNPDFVKRRFVLHTRYRVGERDPEIHARAGNRAAPFQGS